MTRRKYSLASHTPDFNVQASKRGGHKAAFGSLEEIRPRMTVTGSCPTHGIVIVWTEDDPDMPKEMDKAEIRCIQGTVPSLVPFMTGVCNQLLNLRISNPIPTPKKED